jgi:hypothetical protein
MAHHHTRKLAERSGTGDEGINRASKWLLTRRRKISNKDEQKADWRRKNHCKLEKSGL